MSKETAKPVAKPVAKAKDPEVKDPEVKDPEVKDLEAKEDSVPHGETDLTSSARETLTGLALTQSLNEQTPGFDVFIPEEYDAGQGIRGEVHRVHNVPEEFQTVWTTAHWIDSGMHRSYLLSMGYRHVMLAELSSVPTTDAMYCTGVFEGDDKGRVVMGDSYLLIGSAQKITASRNFRNEEQRQQAQIVKFNPASANPGGKPVDVTANKTDRVPVSLDYDPTTFEKLKGPEASKVG